MTSGSVSIPDRVLGIFRLRNEITKVAKRDVSIPDRVLGIFRPFKGEIMIIELHHMFQSLIGF